MSNGAGDEYAPCRACKVFVGGLHMDTDNESMKVYFEKYGQINDSVVMRDGETQKSRGFGFVTFSDISQATVCINDKPHLLQEKEVEVKMAVPKKDSRPVKYSSERTKKVFLGGISPETKKEDIMAVFVEYGITDATVMTEKGTERPRGFAFAMFDNFEDAEKVCKDKYFQILGRSVEAKKAQSQEQIQRTTAGGQEDRPPRDEHDRDMYGRPGYYKGDYGYPRGYSDYYMREWGYPGYDRAAAAAAYYGSGGGYPGRYGQHPNAQGYDMAAYAAMYSGGMSMGSYGNQSPSGYGPSRGPYGGDKDRDRGGGRGAAGYHPYRR